MKLYSYVLRYDGGSAPNPYWGICTLVICKPIIRRSAEIGDWVVGLGSANSPIGDISTCVVYGMKVTSKLTLKEYDQFCQSSLPQKIPQWTSQDYHLQMGDCIYQYGAGELPQMREAVHKECERARDLSGGYALLSKHFYYFGDNAVPLPEHLYPIIHRTQGYKSNQNQPYAQIFVDWIESLGLQENKLYGEPQFKSKSTKHEGPRSNCSTPRVEDHSLFIVKQDCTRQRRSRSFSKSCHTKENRLKGPMSQ